jgi:hypothetical protein
VGQNAGPLRGPVDRRFIDQKTALKYGTKREIAKLVDVGISIESTAASRFTIISRSIPEKLRCWRSAPLRPRGSRNGARRKRKPQLVTLHVTALQERM